LRDLFDENGYLADPALLDRLALEQLGEIANEVRAEGWKWIDTCLDFSAARGMRRVYPQQVDLPKKKQRASKCLRASMTNWSSPMKMAIPRWRWPTSLTPCRMKSIGWVNRLHSVGSRRNLPPP
jgi:hypothetical protein